MPQDTLRQHLSLDRIVVVAGRQKDHLFDETAAAAARDLVPLPAADIVKRLWVRERMLSTRLGDHIALPHAQFAGIGRTTVVIALCPDGIEYDAHANQPVHLAICVVGDETSHLAVLSEVASALLQVGASERLVDAARHGDAEAALRILSGDEEAEPGESDPTLGRRTARSQRIWRHALELAPQVGARFILLHTSAARAKRFQVPPDFAGEVFVLTPEELGMPASTTSGAGIAGRLTVALLYALTERRISADDVIISVYGSHDADILDTVRVTDVDAAFRLFFSVSREFALEATTQRVLLRVVELATELGAQGREGKPVGALFVVGDMAAVAPHCQQMLMNPFKGYDARHRNILDPGLAETVKELSRIDGAFVISGDGVIESAGTYLRVDVAVPDLPAGLGARHAAAAAITAGSDAVAVAVSESTGQVSIFRHGRRVVVL